MSDPVARQGREPSFWQQCSPCPVPWFWKPLLWTYGFSVASGFICYHRLVHATSRVTVCGAGRLTPGQAYIYSCWHDRFPIYLSSLPRLAGQVWMVLPSWSTQPMRIFALWSGVERIVHGATGHRGAEAKAELIQELRQGRSTVFLPDGPSRDPRKLRKGILEMALATGLEIVPMRPKASREIRLPTWDRKRPFSRIEIDYGTPIRVIRVDDPTLDAVSAALSG